MFKLTIFLVIGFLTSAIAENNLIEHKTTVDKISKKNIFIKNSDNFSIGSSGVVVHAFDKTHKAIVATVEVIEKKGAVAKLKYKNFNDLKQDALPNYKITPKVGDSVILNFLYKRALAITPNKETFNYVLDTYQDIEWIHPDIFASKLYIDYTPKPQKGDFKTQCNDNNFALIFFAISDRGYFVDCNSFKIIDTIKLTNIRKDKEIKVPFYSRVKKVEGRIFGLMGGDGITDYSSYYKKLLGIK